MDSRIGSKHANQGCEEVVIGTNKRRYQRLPLAIPIFLKGRDEGGKDFLELTMAVNVSAGGALLVTRRLLPRASKLTLEMPASPIQAFLCSTKSRRSLQGRVIRSSSKDFFNFCAVRFSRPLI